MTTNTEIIMVPIVCSWCSKVLGETKACDQVKDGVSHGICADCEAKFFNDCE